MTNTCPKTPYSNLETPYLDKPLPFSNKQSPYSPKQAKYSNITDPYQDSEFCTPAYLLNEDGSYLLQNNGYRIIL